MTEWIVVSVPCGSRQLGLTDDDGYDDDNDGGANHSATGDDGGGGDLCYV